MRTQLHILLSIILSLPVYTQAQSIKPDSNFGHNGIFTYPSKYKFATSVGQQKNGKLILLLPDTSYIKTIRLTTYGKIDSSYGINGISQFVPPVNALAQKLVINKRDEIVLACHTLNKNHKKNICSIIRLKPDGQLDSSFSHQGIDTINDYSTGDVRIRDMAIQGNGSIIVVGSLGPGPGTSLCVRILENGRIDSTFPNQLSGYTDPPTGYCGYYGSNTLVSVDDSDRVFIGSYAVPTNSYCPYGDYFTYQCFKPDGTPDSSFCWYGTYYQILPVLMQPAFVVQNNKKEYLLGQNVYSGLYFIHVDSIGKVIPVSLLSTYPNTFYGIGAFCMKDNKFVLGGYTQKSFTDFEDMNYMLERLTPNAAPDSTFGYNSIDTTCVDSLRTTAFKMVLQKDGKILLCGLSIGVNPLNSYVSVVRYIINENLNTNEVEATKTKCSVYPNPANDIIYLNTGNNAERFNADLTDLTGRSVWHADNLNGKTNINTSGLPDGLYLCHVTINGEVLTRKVVVNH